MARSIVGIDLGGSYVKLVMREGGSHRVVARRLPEDIIDSGTIVAPETMAQFLRDTRTEEHIRPKDCAVVLGPEQCFFRHVTLPAMTVAELKLNLPYEFRDYIDDDPSSYVYDYAVDELVRDDVGTPQRLELYAAAVQQATVDRLNTMLKKGGLPAAGRLPLADGAVAPARRLRGRPSRRRRARRRLCGPGQRLRERVALPRHRLPGAALDRVWLPRVR